MEKENYLKSISEAFDPEKFRDTAHNIIDILYGYMKNIISGKNEKALPDISPETMLGLWDGSFTGGPDKGYLEKINEVISQSNHLHNPKYIGHQVCAPLPAAVLFDLIGKFLNNASAIYEMGPVNIIMEKRLSEWMCRLIGYNEKSDGIFTSGGTLGNLTALLAARQVKTDYDVWKEGVKAGDNFSIMVPELAHYSIQKAAGIMGLGEKSIIPVPCDSSFRTDTGLLEEIYKNETLKGKKIFAITGNACSTAVGNYDDLEKIADFAEKHNLWFHIDGAHGASALLSGKYKELLKGIERADSVVWDAHKMLLMPALITAVLFRDGKNSFEAFSQKASYLFENAAEEEWYNYGHRTMECTKTMMGAKLYLCLKLFGTDLFSQYVTGMYDLTKEFAEIIKKSDDFELAVEPDSNIICFRYITKNPDPNELQKTIRKKVLESEKFYIVQTMLKNNQYLRCTIINPLTKLSDLLELQDLIRNIAKV